MKGLGPLRDEVTKTLNLFLGHATFKDRLGGTGRRGDGPISSGTGGVVNQLLVQLQSFDTPPLGERLCGRLTDWGNGRVPATAQLAKRPPRYNNLLVIAATNRFDAAARRCCAPGASTAGPTPTCPTPPADPLAAGHNDTEERWTRTRTELFAFPRIACAGMAAGELWFGGSTTGPGADLVAGAGRGGRSGPGRVGSPPEVT